MPRPRGFHDGQQSRQQRIGCTAAGRLEVRELPHRSRHSHGSCSGFPSRLHQRRPHCRAGRCRFQHPHQCFVRSRQPEQPARRRPLVQVEHQVRVRQCQPPARVGVQLPAGRHHPCRLQRLEGRTDPRHRDDGWLRGQPESLPGLRRSSGRHRQACRLELQRQRQPPQALARRCCCRFHPHGPRCERLLHRHPRRRHGTRKRHHDDGRHWLLLWCGRCRYCCR